MYISNYRHGVGMELVNESSALALCQSTRTPPSLCKIQFKTSFTSITWRCCLIQAINYWFREFPTLLLTNCNVTALNLPPNCGVASNPTAKSHLWECIATVWRFKLLFSYTDVMSHITKWLYKNQVLICSCITRPGVCCDFNLPPTLWGSAVFHIH